jgi:SAM-dependent methyltransferase
MDVTTASERLKYKRMWALPGYSVTSPGLAMVDYFLQSVEWERGEVVLDAGCGTGRAAMKLKANGLNAIGLDFVDAREPASKDLAFIDACLWEAKGIPKFDWVFCADVMEHLPNEHVEATLNNLSRATVKGGLFQIALFHDGYGKYIGETLHLTVQPPEWWMEKIVPRWHVQLSTVTHQHLVVTLGPPK